MAKVRRKKNGFRISPERLERVVDWILSDGVIDGESVSPESLGKTIRCRQVDRAIDEARRKILKDVGAWNGREDTDPINEDDRQTLELVKSRRDMASANAAYKRLLGQIEKDGGVPDPDIIKLGKDLSKERQRIAQAFKDHLLKVKKSTPDQADRRRIMPIIQITRVAAEVKP